MTISVFKLLFILITAYLLIRGNYRLYKQREGIRPDLTNVLTLLLNLLTLLAIFVWLASLLDQVKITI